MALVNAFCVFFQSVLKPKLNSNFSWFCFSCHRYFILYQTTTFSWHLRRAFKEVKILNLFFKLLTQIFIFTLLCGTSEAPQRSGGIKISVSFLPSRSRRERLMKKFTPQVLITTKKMEELKRECDTRVKEYAQLLDIRAERIKVWLMSILLPRPVNLQLGYLHNLYEDFCICQNEGIIFNTLMPGGNKRSYILE